MKKKIVNRKEERLKKNMSILVNKIIEDLPDHITTRTVRNPMPDLGKITEVAWRLEIALSIIEDHDLMKFYDAACKLIIVPKPKVSPDEFWGSGKGGVNKIKSKEKKNE